MPIYRVCNMMLQDILSYARARRVRSSNSIGQLKISEVPIEPEATARTYFNQLLEEVDQ